MEISEMKENRVLIMQLKGRLDGTTAGDFQQKLISTIQNGESQIIIDCSALEYISSIGLRVFLIAAKKLKAGNGKLAFCSLQSHIKEVFDISGFVSIFSILPTKEEALKALTG